MVSQFKKATEVSQTKKTGTRHGNKTVTHTVRSPSIKENNTIELKPLYYLKTIRTTPGDLVVLGTIYDAHTPLSMTTLWALQIVFSQVTTNQ